ncbi:unnamed protein product [Moneuplotes crassus]|uniref:Uncharacterized protein n=1 Tax=Euplotes crassus TaxID=5936 RepID=A0AAD2D0V9_EUPCR|nr:unnamed protein product [Moneuplotes crassus]
MGTVVGCNGRKFGEIRDFGDFRGREFRGWRKRVLASLSHEDCLRLVEEIKKSRDRIDIVETLSCVLILIWNLKSICRLSECSKIM